MFSRIYIHVPFCIKKCGYCAFVSAPPADAELIEYSGLLMREMQLHAQKAARPVSSVYFGGGTPSLLQPLQLADVLATIAAGPGISATAEITMEANPGTLGIDSLKAFRDTGINRLSLGFQSFDDHFLNTLGRIHCAAESRSTFFDSRRAGFDNISIDLMHSLPGQSLEQWRHELQCAVSLEPEHISVYGLTVEAGTPFARTYPEQCPELADDDLSADMYELADEFLTDAGFDHYETANYARPGRRSRHNSGYWRRDGYLGLGVAAHSFFLEGYGLRFSNPATLSGYREGVQAGLPVRIDEQQLTLEEAMSEFLFLGLRLTEGIRLPEFEREFCRSAGTVYGAALSDLCRLGLLTQEGDSLAMTKRGMLLSNQVLSRFV